LSGLPVYQGLAHRPSQFYPRHTEGSEFFKLG
jgi:hypothetical protein